MRRYMPRLGLSDISGGEDDAAGRGQSVVKTPACCRDAVRLIDPPYRSCIRYCDTYHRHPAKEKDRFVPAVRNERYACKNPKQGSCDCKACHSLRRFEEMYPKCEGKLDEFKRRTYMFEDSNMEKPNRSANFQSTNVAGGGGTESGDQHTRGARGHDDAGPKVTYSSGMKEAFYVEPPSPSGAYSSVYGNAAAPKTPQPSFNSHTKESASSEGGGAARRSYRSQHDLSDVASDNGAADTGSEGNVRKRKSTEHYDAAHAAHTAKQGRQGGYHDDVISSLLPSYMFNAPLPPNSRQGLLSTTKADTSSLDLEGDSLYKDMFLEDPLSFSALENMAQTAPLHTWKCALCASWNHPGNVACARCYTARM
eukprot:m.1331008 g.1331008  ORF g.1331008 m.1331008 type:complete len:366 (+) comp24862_c0_seq27:152-1249(+)